MGFKVKKWEFYTVDLEPIDIDAMKCLMENYVFNRISTNIIAKWDNIQEVNVDEEWGDDIRFNKKNCPIEEYEKLFKVKK